MQTSRPEIFGIWSSPRLGVTACSGWYGPAMSPPYAGNKQALRALIEQAESSRFNSFEYEIRLFPEELVDKVMSDDYWWYNGVPQRKTV